MKITAVDIKRYNLPLTNPLNIKGQKINTRSGAILRLTDDTGNTACGELAPLENLHKETLDQAITQLAGLKNKLQEIEIAKDFLNFNSHFSKILSGTYPSVSCAIEMAFFNLLRLQGDFFAGLKKIKLPVNGLLTADTPDIGNAAKDLINAGYTSIKIKVGSSPLGKDMEIINKLTKTLVGKASLRLDANRQWSLKDALEFCNSISSPVIEYIEEPLTDIEDLPELIGNTKTPIALDETLVENGLTYAARIQNIKAYILKPSLLGGFDASAKFIRHAKTQNITPVISAAFPTSVSLKAYSLFAAKMNLSNIHHGLDTLKFLKSDILENPFKVTDGKVDLAGIIDSKDKLRCDLLEEL